MAYVALLEISPEREPFDGDVEEENRGFDLISRRLHPEDMDPARLGWKPVVKVEHYHLAAEKILTGQTVE